MKETYTHHFPGGITATATVDHTGLRVEWSEFPPPREFIPEYLRWRQTFVADYARKTGQKIMLMDLIH